MSVHPFTGAIGFDLDSVTYQVSPNTNGSFECPCPLHLGSEKIYASQPEYLDHIALVQQALSSSFVELGPFRFLSSHLLETPGLMSLGLAIDTRHKLLLCLSCLAAIIPSQLKSHLYRKHEAKFSEKNRASFLPLFSLCRIKMSALPELKEPLLHKIEGLPVVKTHPCPCCLTVGTTYESLKAHMRQKHKGVSYPDESNMVIAQAVHTGTSRRLLRLRVEEPLVAQFSAQDILSQASNMLTRSSALSNPSTPSTDPREFCPWLRRIRWQDLTVGKQVDELIALAKFPTEEEYSLLSDGFLRLLLSASALFDTTSELILQRLNTPKPGEDINLQPFKRLQNHSEMLKQYRIPVLRLLAMLLRGSTVPMTFEIQEAIQSLQASLSSTDLEIIANRILHVLSLIWQRSWLPLVNHRISDPTIAYLALSSLEPTGKFKGADEVTPAIARIEYTMRLVFLIIINRSSDGQEAGYRRIAPFLLEGQESTFNSLRNAQRQASSIAYLTKGLPKVWWLDRRRYQEMIYRGTRIHLRQLHSLLAALEQRMQTMWEEDILMGLKHLHVSYDEIHDDLACTEVGYSFLTDPRNTCFSDKLILLGAILQNRDLASRLVAFNANGVLRFNVLAGRAWLTKYAKFHLHLLLRFYLTGGSPSRGTSLMAMLLENIPTYPLRNLVAFGAYISLNCTYSKTSGLSGYDKIIPHALDAFTADLLIQELAIARPFAKLMAKACYPDQPDICSLFDKHVFVNHNKLFKTDDLTHALEKHSTEFMDIELGVSDWRHISAAFRNKLCGRLEELIEDDDEHESIGALQMGHSRQTENRVYGISQEALHGAPEDILPLFLDASTDWQVVCRVVPGGLSLCYQDALMPSFDSLVQSGRISLAVNPDPSTESLAAMIQNLSSQVAELARSPPSKTPSLSPTLTVQKRIFDEEAALEALRSLLKNPAAQWKTDGQRASIMAVLESEHDVVAVLPTNAGKSMVAIVPPILERDSVTVLILPLRVLILDFERKLREMGVSFVTYDSNQPFIELGSSNIILISADRVKWDSWKQAILVLHQRRPVTRMVVDEAHIPLLSQDFRHALQHMSDIRISMPIQLVLLTASAHEALLEAMRSDYQIEPEAVVIRGPPNRPELRYVWQPVGNLDEIVQIIRAAIQSEVCGKEDRAMVFVPWKDLGGQLEQKLNYPFYQGGEENRDKHGALYQSWLAGDPPVMIATSAFGTGNDYAHVRLVVHVYAPYEMTYYVQEVSRAGRDGSSALCLLLYKSGETRSAARHGDPEDLGGKHAMTEAMQRPMEKCIRYRITSYADREQGVHCGSDPCNQTCGCCARKQSLVAHHPTPFEAQMDAAKRQRTMRSVSHLSHDEILLLCLRMVTKTCSYCFIHSSDPQVPANHTFSNCSKMPKSDFIEWRRDIRYSKGISVCYHCHVPQGEKDALHPTFTKAAASACEFRDIIAPLVYGLLKHDIHKASLSAQFSDLNTTTPLTALAWINSKPIQGQVTNLCALFIWYCRQFL